MGTFNMTFILTFSQNCYEYNDKIEDSKQTTKYIIPLFLFYLPLLEMVSNVVVAIILPRQIVQNSSNSYLSQTDYENKLKLPLFF